MAEEKNNGILMAEEASAADGDGQQENEEASFDPFSPELALQVCQENREQSERLIGEIREGLQNGADQEELLLKATEVIGRMTNNTILKSLVEKALNARKSLPVDAAGMAGTVMEASQETDEAGSVIGVQDPGAARK